MTSLLQRLFDRRIRGFRVVEMASFAVLIVLVLGVYLAKAAASRERASIARIELQIGEEQRRLRGLRAEAAHLEQPARLEALSGELLSLKPVDASQEVGADGLARIDARRTAPATGLIRMNDARVGSAPPPATQETPQ